MWFHFIDLSLQNRINIMRMKRTKAQRKVQGQTCQSFKAVKTASRTVSTVFTWL